MKHQDTENILNRFVEGQYEYVDRVMFADITTTDGSKDNIRPTGLIEDRVMQYALGMEQGDEFPPIVLYKKAARFRLLGGAHRIEAAKLIGRESFAAYVVSLDSTKDERTIEVLQRMLNMYHGANPDKNERLMHALRFHELGFTLESVSAMTHLKVGYIRNKLWDIEARERAVNLNVPMVEQESASVEINRIKNNDLFIEASKLAHAARLTVEEIKAMAGEIRSQTKESDAFAVVNRWKTENSDRIKATASGRYQMPASKARNALHYLRTMEQKINPESFQSVTLHELDQAIASVKSGIKKLQQLHAQLETLRQKRTKNAVA